jgi:hypothetical protein
VISKRPAHRSAAAGVLQRRRKVGAPERFEVTLDGLRQLLRRAVDRQLDRADWPLIVALVSKQLARAEERNERMIAKVVAAATASPNTSEPLSDAKASNDAAASPAGSSSSYDASTTSSEEAASRAAKTGGDDEQAPAPEADGDPKPKGHGRNGASAYRTAQHLFYALAIGVIACTGASG